MSSEKAVAESDYDKIIKDFNQNLIDETGLGMNPRVQFLAKMLMSELDKLRDEEREKEREELREAIIDIPTRTEAPDNPDEICFVSAAWFQMKVLSLPYFTSQSKKAEAV